MRDPVSPLDLGRRGAVLVLALLQLAAAGLVPVADAGLRDYRVEGKLHVEASGSEDCSPPHDHLFCQLCRTLLLAAVLGPAYPAPLLDLPSLQTAARRGGDGVLSRTSLHDALGPRAPPFA